MDQNEQQMLETASELNKNYEFLKKTLQFLVPVSILSFLLSYTSGFSFFCSYNFHFSTLVFPLFTHTIERKYMFLICNGILAFLTKNLSFSSSSPTDSDLNDKFERSNEDGVKPVPEQSNMKAAPLEDNEATTATESSVGSPDNVPPADQEEEVTHEHENGYLNTEVEERKSGALIRTETEESESLIAATAAAEEEEEEGSEMNMSTDEMNRKFEEFIRKMKKELWIEAQRQLIAV